MARKFKSMKTFAALDAVGISRVLSNEQVHIGLLCVAQICADTAQLHAVNQLLFFNAHEAHRASPTAEV